MNELNWQSFEDLYLELLNTRKSQQMEISPLFIRKVVSVLRDKLLNVSWMVRLDGSNFYKRPIAIRGNYPYGYKQKCRLRQCARSFIDDKECVRWLVTLSSHRHTSHYDSWEYIKTNLPKFIRKIRRMGISKYIAVFCSDIEGYCCVDLFVAYPTPISPALYVDEIKELKKKILTVWNGDIRLRHTPISTYFDLLMEYDIEKAIVRAGKIDLSNRNDIIAFMALRLLLTHYFLDKFKMRQFIVSKNLVDEGDDLTEKEEKKDYEHSHYIIIEDGIKYDSRFVPVTGKIEEGAPEYDYIYELEELRDGRRNRRKYRSRYY